MPFHIRIDPEAMMYTDVPVARTPNSPSPAMEGLGSLGVPLHISKTVLKTQRNPVCFHIYSQIPDLTTRLAQTVVNLRRLPPSHLEILDPFFVVDRFPGGRATSGGYWTPAAVTQWLGRSRVTGVPDQDIQMYVLSKPNTGLIGITRTAFMKSIYQFTVFHELAHSVDLHLGIVPRGATLSDFAGVKYPRPRIGEYAAEAYARFMLRPGAVCRAGSIPPGETPSQCTRRLIQMLRSSPAFARIPREWQPAA